MNHSTRTDRPPCPSLTPGIHPNSCSLNRYAIQPSYPLSSPSPPALNLSQNQGLLKWVSSSHQVAKVIALISHASKVMLKIIQARLQQYMNHEFPDVQVGFRKGRGTRDQIVNIRWIIKKAREFQKNIYFCFIDYGKAFDCVDHNKLWKILKQMRIPDHLTCLLRNLYAGQEATVRTGHGTTDCFQIGKGVHQGCILSPCLFNLYAEYIMRNTGLEETQAGIKIAGRNINNLRHADDSTLMAESEGAS